MPTPLASRGVGLYFRACLHEGGGPQVGEVTCGKLPHLTCKRDHIKMRDYMDRRVTPPKRVTSPTWGPPPPCKQVLIDELLDYKVIEKSSNEDHSKLCGSKYLSPLTKILVIVDSTAAPALYIVGQWYSWSLCSSLEYTDS